MRRRQHEYLQCNFVTFEIYHCFVSEWGILKMLLRGQIEVRAGERERVRRWWQRISARVYCSCPNRRLSIYFSMNTLLPARPRLSKFICSVWFTLYRCLFVITAAECFIAGAGLKSHTTLLFFAIFPHDLFRIWSLFNVFFFVADWGRHVNVRQTNQ